MNYRIELEKIDRRFSGYDYNESCKGSKEVNSFLKECIPEGYKVVKIVKTTKDGKGYDVTNKYIK